MSARTGSAGSSDGPVAERVQAWLSFEWRLVTPGQRWTAGLALALSASLLAFGLPAKVEVTERQVGRLGQADRSTSEGGPPAGAPVAAPPSGPRPAVVPIAGPAGATSGDRVTGGSAPARPPARPPERVVLLARDDATAVVGRSDADIAAVFLRAAGFDGEVVTAAPGDDTAACREAGGRNTVVVTSFGATPTLRDCLVASGAVVVGYEAGGDLPTTPAGGEVVSSARGAGPSLVDLARWAVGAVDDLGAVAVVSTVDLAPYVEPAVALLPSVGVEVAATVLVPGGPEGEAAVTDAVREVAASGAATVVFVAPVELQRRWLARASVLAPGLRYLVSDAADSVLDERYPPTFDGALAHTSLRTPWFEREEQPTTEQAACRSRWEEAAVPSTALGPVELARAYAWCQHVALVDAALAGTAAAGSFPSALRGLSAQSPLTSALGPLPDRTWGPTADAVLRWRAACGCWESVEEFASRDAGADRRK